MKTEERIRNIVFDLGGVLIDIDPERCVHRFEELGVKEAAKFMAAEDFKVIFQRFERGDIDANEFRSFIRSKNEVLKDVSDEDIDYAWNGMLIGIPRYKLDLLLELRSHYVVFLLSNTNSIHWQWALDNPFQYRGFRAEDFFEQEYLSFRLRTCKPEITIFERVLENANIEPHETLFIDDRPENTKAAETLGIKTYTPKANEDWSFLFDNE
ncbi:MULTISPECIES: HAD family phosphatase [Bacteroides]|nr:MULTISPECIES: HAD family phosphatase [Bacteroides]HJD91605.1 HAD family phosphatase [Bacteroides coprosuis]